MASFSKGPHSSLVFCLSPPWTCVVGYWWCFWCSGQFLLPVCLDTLTFSIYLYFSGYFSHSSTVNVTRLCVYWHETPGIVHWRNWSRLFGTLSRRMLQWMSTIYALFGILENGVQSRRVLNQPIFFLNTPIFTWYETTTNTRSPLSENSSASLNSAHEFTNDRVSRCEANKEVLWERFLLIHTEDWGDHTMSSRKWSKSA